MKMLGLVNKLLALVQSSKTGVIQPFHPYKPICRCLPAEVDQLAAVVHVLRVQRVRVHPLHSEVGSGEARLDVLLLFRFSIRRGSRRVARAFLTLLLLRAAALAWAPLLRPAALAALPNGVPVLVQLFFVVVLFARRSVSLSVSVSLLLSYLRLLLRARDSVVDHVIRDSSLDKTPWGHIK